MSRPVLRISALGLVLMLCAMSHGQGTKPAPIPKPAPAPKLEAVAETKLLMEGLAHANFRGLERLLNQPPDDVQAWTFARGQALLVAETANLLMLRPPKSQGQAEWFDRAADLRTQAAQLAQAAARQDYAGSRQQLKQLAVACNRCHRTFRINVEIVPFAMPPPKAE